MRSSGVLIRSITGILVLWGWTAVQGQTISTQIIVDQFGWRTTAKKVVVFADPQSGQNNGSTYTGPGAYFTIRKVSDNSRVFSNTAIPWNGGATHSQSQDKCWLGDFSALTTAGDYYVQDANSKKSFNFKISDDVYTEVLRHSVRMYLYQRCGTNVSVVNGGNWNHPNCHIAAGQDHNAWYLTNGAALNRQRDVSGGWHDAGDYRKYIQFLTATMWELLQAYEMNPAKFPDNYNIPESGNGVPDLLDEVKVELDWMLKMQKTNLGYVFSRVIMSNMSGGVGAPNLDTYARYYTRPTSWATAIFAATTAKASRIFQSVNPGYAAVLLRAATNAWAFLRVTPALWPAGGSDGNCGTWAPGCTADAAADERDRIYASAELFRLTGRAEYHQFFTNNYDDYANTRDNGHHPLEANRFDPTAALELNQAFITYALTPGNRPDITTKIKNAIEGQCANTVAMTNQDPYRAPMYNGHYTWGSSQIKARWGNILIYGAMLGVNPSRSNLYRRMAEDYLNYFHGRNPLNWCFLSHMEPYGGDKCVSEEYHGWFADGTALYDGKGSTYGMPPGYVTGGPNQFYSGATTPPRNEPIMKAYWDWNGVPDASWEVTEPAIYYQAAYIQLLSGFATPPGLSISNYQATPSLLTNNKAKVVQFSAYVNPGSGYSITTATLYLAPLGGAAVRMSNIAGNFWRFSYTVPFQYPSAEYTIAMKAYNNQGVSMDSWLVVQVLTPSFLPVLILYDGEAPPTSYLEAWRYGTADFQDAAGAGLVGSTGGRLIVSNWGSGAAQLRDSSWSGLDASQADTLEMWVRGTTAAAGYAQVRLFDRGSRYSANLTVDVKPYYWKTTYPITLITNKALGANPAFDMSGIIGIEFMDNGGVTPPGTTVWFDNVILSARVLLKNLSASPSTPDNSKTTNVQFSCRARSALTNISSVTLDLTPLGGPKTAMTNLSAMTSFRFTWTLVQGKNPGTYILPVTAWDRLGGFARAAIYLTVTGPVPKIVKIVYDGESTLTDVNWETWWGAIAASDINDVNVLKGSQSMRLVIGSNYSGGIQVAEPANWTGVDVTAADRFQFYYKSPVALTLSLFSYDPVNGVQYSKTFSLPAAPGYRFVMTNLSQISNGLFSYKKFVGAQIASAGGTGTAYFDEMYFTTMVEILNARATPSVITNTKKNTVQFAFKARSGNTAITNAYINLSQLGGPANAKMTNLSGMTLFRYTFTVASNQLPGTYWIPVRALDNKGYSGKATIPLNIFSRPLYDVAIVYDGDIIAANAEQWFPTPPPSSAWFYDVDSGTTDPHTGSLSGRFFITNAMGSMFHIRDPLWTGIDCSTAHRLEIWAKGQSGGETVRLTFVFITASNATRFSRATNLALTPDWNLWSMPVSAITNGTGLDGNISRLVGMEIFTANRNDSIYLDDIKFTTYLKITNEMSSPALVDKEKDTVVTLSCQAFTRNNNITSVTLDMTLIGGGRVKMTNVSGSTNFRYSFTIKSNFLLTSGLKALPLKITDNQGFIAYSTIGVRLISTKIVTWIDFETGTAGGFWNQSGNGHPAGLFPLPTDTPCGTNNVAALGMMLGHNSSGSAYWDIDMDQKAFCAVTDPDSLYKCTYYRLLWVNTGAADCKGDVHIPDLTAFKGWYIYVLFESGPTIDAEGPPWSGGIGYKGGASGWWHDGPYINLVPDEWKKIYYPFTTIAPDPITELNENGVRMEGGYNTSGIGRFYFDDMVGMDWVAPAVPQNLAVSDPATGGTLHLSWDPVLEKDLEKYIIFGSTTANPATAVLVAYSKTNWYDDKAVWNGTPNYYWVSAIDTSSNVSAKSAMANGAASGVMPAVTYPYKGTTLLALPGELPGNFMTELSNMILAGVTTVGVPVTWFMAASNSITFTSNAAQTLSDRDLVYVITNVHRKGMKVFLIPRILVSSGVPISRITPATPATWFQNYTNILKKYATIAFANKVELFSIGYELHTMTLAAQNANWIPIAAMARRICTTNKLTFCSRVNAEKGYRTALDDVSYRNLCVWDKVDFIGLDADYWRLVEGNGSPPMNSVWYRWNDYEVSNPKFTFPWLKNLESWLSAKFPSKKVIFTELAYASMNNAATTPWLEGGATNNNNLQRDCYEAAFRRIWDKDWVTGSFWSYWKPTAPATPNQLHCFQGKPAYTVVDEWYSIRPHHFAIVHGGGGESQRWIPVVIQVHQIDENPIFVYTGTVTLNINRGTQAAISWTNLSTSGCGTLVDWGPGSAKAVFTFNLACGGTATLGIKDNSMETINLSVHNGALKESPLEDPDMILTGPLSHYEVVHDGWAITQVPEPVKVRAIDVFGNLKVNYSGTVTLYLAGSTGNVRWTNVTPDPFFANLGGGAAVCRFDKTGEMDFTLTDNSVETIGVKAKDPTGSYVDDDTSNPLRVIAFHHFHVLHDGAGLMGFLKSFAIVAEDASDQVVYGVNGNVTISFDTNVTGRPLGPISLSLLKGGGTLTPLGSSAWVYTMLPGDAGLISLGILDPSADSIDIEASDGLHHDADYSPRYLAFATHKYHYVSRLNPSPVAPYIQPSTASTNIWAAISSSSPGDVILILDSETYPPVVWPYNQNRMKRTLAGASATNKPRIFSLTAIPIDFGAYDYNQRAGWTFKNLKFVTTGRVAVSPLNGCNPAFLTTNAFYNCSFSNAGANMVDAGCSYLYFKDCDFTGSVGFNICNNAAGGQWIGNSFANFTSLWDVDANPAFQRVYGNIIRRLAGGIYYGSAGTGAPFNYNTCFRDLDPLNSGQILTISNCIALSNAGTGIKTTAPVHDYNHAWGNATANFQGGSMSANDKAEDPQFVNPSAGDFRLKAASPCYNSGQPNAGIRACRGALTWGVRPRERNVNTVTVYTMTFAPFRDIPATGIVDLTFPAGVDISGVTSVTSTSAWGGSFGFSVSGNFLQIQRSGTGAVAPALRAQNLIVSGVKNPSFAGQTYSLTVATRANNPTLLEGDWLDYPRPSNCFEIITADLVLLKGSPSDGSAGLPLTTSLTCAFNTNLIGSTANVTNLYLQNSGWQKVPASFSFQNGGKTAILTPLLPLEANELYTVTVTRGVLNGLGGSLVQQTQWRFSTGTGATTPHIYNTVLPNGSLSEWQSANITGTNLSGKTVELARDDGGIDTTWGQTRQIWATWNTNNLYIAVKKPVMAGNEWWDYVSIDTTRNAAGATNGPAGWHPMSFFNNRRPEFILMFDHNNLGPVWDAWTNFRWTGAVWQANAITATNHGQDAGGTVEVRIPWSVFGGGVPNRISLAAFVFTSPVFAGPLYDSCPETVNAGTNWVTIDPDNDGNDVPDYVRVMDHFVVQHDGSAGVGLWEPFAVRVMDNQGGVYSNYAGLVTLSLSLGTSPNVRFTNRSGAGSLNFLGNGKATYQWVPGDLGLISLMIVDSSIEAVNIRVASGGTWPKYDENTEGDLNFTSEARLRITKSGTPSLAAVGDILTYRLEVTNLDGWYSYGVNVADVIPRGTTYVAGSMREGAKSSIYTNANILTDGPDDDYGSYDGTKVIFCGPGSGVAPGTSGALAGGSVWAAYFRVRVRGTNSVTMAKVANLTNADTAFDGYVVNDGTFNAGTLIAAGDSANPENMVNVGQLSNNRDHYFSYDPDNIGYQGYADGVTFQVGNANIGGAGGEDNYHSYLTFGLAGVPANALVTSATLFIRQSAAAGAGLDNPIHVDHVDYQNVYINTPLDANRFNCSGTRSVLEADMFTFNGLAAIGWVSIPSTAQVQYAHANPKSFNENGVSRVFQVMLRDNIEVMGAANGLATFSAQNDATPANRPYLRVYYEFPGKEVRGYTGFDVSKASNGNITSATLFVYRTNVLGSAAAVSAVAAESVDYGVSLDAGDFGASFLKALGSFGVSAPGWTGVNATSAVSNAKAVKKLWQKNASSNWLQVRFRTTLLATNNLQADQQLLGSAESFPKSYLRVYYPQTYISGPWNIVTNTVVLGTNSAVATILVQAGGTTLAAVKQITNVTLKGSPSAAVPGATISFRISCSNRTMTSGINAMVVDKVVTNTMFVTNSATAGSGGWTLEYSTNAAPAMTFVSANFTTVQPSSTKVRWIRWKRASWAGLAKDSFRYRVIVR